MHTSHHSQPARHCPAPNKFKTFPVQEDSPLAEQHTTISVFDLSSFLSLFSCSHLPSSLHSTAYSFLSPLAKDTLTAWRTDSTENVPHSHHSSPVPSSLTNSSFTPPWLVAKAAYGWAVPGKMSAVTTGKYFFQQSAHHLLLFLGQRDPANGDKGHHACTYMYCTYPQKPPCMYIHVLYLPTAKHKHRQLD